MAGTAVANVFVGGVFERSAGVANRRARNAGHLVEVVLYTPETPCRKNHLFHISPFFFIILHSSFINYTALRAI